MAFAILILATLQEVYQDGLLNQVPDMQMLSRAQLHRQEPNLSSEALAGLWAPSAGIICPYSLTVGMAENAARNGAEFRLDTSVEHVIRDVDGWIVRTNHGDLKTKTVVNAAGLYSDIFNNQVSAVKLRIIPRRGEYWMLDKSYAGTFKSTIFQVPGKMGKGVLISPTVDGTIIVGPTADDIDNRDDVETTAVGQEHLFQSAQRIWPGLSRRALITSFAGNRSHLTQADFVLGQPADAPGFFNAAGIESPGLTAAPAIAQELAAAIAEHLQAAPNPAFEPTRPPVRRFRFMTMPERRDAIAADPNFGRIICRCEQVTEAEVRDCIRRPLGARSVDGDKRRTRAGMGRCQGGFCLPRVVGILSEELGVSPLQIHKNSDHSPILTDRFEALSGKGQL